MAAYETKTAANPQVDAAELFARLGLKPADIRPIQESWRHANADWQRERLQRITDHAQRVKAHLLRFQRPPPTVVAARSRMSKRRAVWCVELRQRFETLSDAARFVGRSPSNISQSLLRGVRCGTYHWEEFDAAKHEPGEGHAKSDARPPG